MRVLGIESSCDDTGIALIENGKILENLVLKQDHKTGVIPEYAARQHHIAIFDGVKKVFKNIDLIAYTNGPGLIGSLFVGSSFAKGLAYGANLPSIAINHLEGHFFLPYWLYEFNFPFQVLLISGGHTLIIEVYDLLNYKVISRSLDDAVGEVLDKIGRHIGLDYPSGSKIEEYATKAKNKYKYKFPKSMINKEQFSFSGLKTAAIKQIQIDSTYEEKYDFCKQLQNHIAYLLCDKLNFFFKKNNIKNWVIAGGVSANKVITNLIENAANLNDCKTYYAPINLCTDNGAMIAARAQMIYPILGPTSFNIKPNTSFVCMKKT